MSLLSPIHLPAGPLRRPLDIVVLRNYMRRAGYQAFLIGEHYDHDKARLGVRILSVAQEIFMPDGHNHYFVRILSICGCLGVAGDPRLGWSEIRCSPRFEGLHILNNTDTARRIGIALMGSGP